MKSQKAKAYPMTPENFGRLRHAISLLEAEPELRLHKIEARDGQIRFSLVLAEVYDAKVHPKDPAIVTGSSREPAAAIELAIASGRELIRAINAPVDHWIFRPRTAH